MEISITAKCSDCCSISVHDLKTNRYWESNGYVPKYIGFGGGDYIELTIDNETGKIKDWVPLTPEILNNNKNFKKE